MLEPYDLSKSYQDLLNDPKLKEVYSSYVN